MKTETVLNMAIAGAVLFVLWKFKERLQSGFDDLQKLPGKASDYIDKVLEGQVQVKAAARLPNGTIVDFNKTVVRNENGVMTFFVGAAKYRVLPRDASGYYGAARIYPKG